MRGREREWRAVLGLFRAARPGAGGVLLLDGTSGAGKSALLAEAADTASAFGFSLAVGRAEMLGRLVPMAPLLSAFNESLTNAMDRPVVLLERLRGRAEVLASVHPVAVVLDDLHWADPATLMALRTLQPQLSAHPLVWLLARNTDFRGAEAEQLFALMEAEGATRIELGPLPTDAVAALVADFLPAPPGREVMELVAGAEGNPLLLTELLAGLCDEGVVHVAGGQSRLISERLPQRLKRAVGRRLERLSGQARQVVETAAVLGGSFLPEDVAEVLGRTPAAILPALQEAMVADVLADAPDFLFFRHDLVRKAVVDGLPPPLRQALHHQIGGILLDRRGSAMEAAHLRVDAQDPGRSTLARLGQVVDELRAETPEAAAAAGGRAMKLLTGDSASRHTLTLDVARAMTEAGRLTEAVELITEALDRDPSPADAARLRCALSAASLLAGETAHAVTEAEKALATPDLPDAVRDQARLVLLQASAEQEDIEPAVRQAASILEDVDGHADAVVVAALTVMSVASWNEGRLDDGIRLAREAVRRAGEGSMAARRTHPGLALVSMLLDAGCLDEAETEVRAAREEVEALGHTAWAAGPALLRARCELAGHRLAAVVSAAEAGLVVADALGTHLFTSLGMAVLGAAALRRGDLQAAAALVEGERAELSPYAAAHGRVRCLLLAAQVAEALGRPRRAMALIAELRPMIERRRSVLIVDPSIAAWLVRLALSEGDRARAETFTAAINALADDNPDFAVVVAAAAHARGLLDGDMAALGVAVAHAADAYARASAREDLGAALALTGECDQAISSFNKALAEYEATGAVRDSARVRRRLRRLGVRHRHWTRGGGATLGWASLTDTQRAVARLVAQGLTNRQAADQMFISMHTVAFHLRQIFRKLDVSSRVDLTRFIVEEDHLRDRSPI
ncbi:helix-turn-helix transcriptional regulator [Nonomuraea sp. bgisy101]|uniref:helix-turn-helix transcriptional regulator n=1 Tax=Nonomuraea sp. bgisy101 TaxID=3413784 RepID=UPI003D71DCD9